MIDRRFLLGAAVALPGAYMLWPRSSETTLPGGLLGQPANAAEGELLPDMVLGDEAAPIEIIEYASFTCPHCASFHKDVYPQLKANYIDEGKVRFVYREVYFDKYGLWAGMLARCAGPVRYFGLVDLLFERQKDWVQRNDADTVQGLYRVGRIAGLDDETMDACLKDNAQAKALVADFQAKAGADGVRATPSFVIDGEMQSNMSYGEFETLLNEKLK